MQILEDFLGEMRKVRPSGAVSPLQQDVATMGRSINPQGKPTAVNLPALGSDRLGMPSGYGEEGTTERDTGGVAQTSSVRGQVPKYSYDFPAYPDFNYPDMPEHTVYPGIPQPWQRPDLPGRRNQSDYPPYPEMPDFGPSTAQEISAYGGIGKASLNMMSAGSRLAFGENAFSGGVDTAMKVINPALAGFNIYNLWQSDAPTGQKVTGTVSQGIQPASQLLQDFGTGIKTATGFTEGAVNSLASGVNEAGQVLGGIAPYVGIGIGAYNTATARNRHAMGKPILDTALSGIALATMEGGPYAGLATAAGQAAFGGIQLYKRNRDERQFETPQMIDTKIRAGIKYALDYGGRVEKADVLKAFTSMGMTKEEAEDYYNNGNFYAPTEVWNDGTWSGKWNDWRTNKHLLEQFGDMSGVEGGATFKDVIENKTGIKPLTPDEYEDVLGEQSFDMTSGGNVTGPMSYRNKRTGDIVAQKPNYDFTWGYDFGDPFAISDVGT